MLLFSATHGRDGGPRPLKGKTRHDEHRPEAGRHPLTGLLVLVELLNELGVDPAPMLAAEGLDAVHLQATEGRVDAAVELAVIRHALRAAAVPDLGLRTGGRHHFGLFGMWGLAIASSPNLASAIRIGLRYIGLVHTFLQWRFREDPARPRLEASERCPLGHARHFVIERDMSACVTLLRDLTGGRLALTGARFPYPRPAWAESYRDVFGPRVAFGGARAVLYLDGDRLRQPLPRANPMAARLAEEQCRELLAGRLPAASLSDRLRRILLAEPGAVPALPQAAAACGLSVRTLRRRLAAEGTSYRRLRDELRLELACRYLADTALTVTEVASRLGYRDRAAFGHAFRRWTGVSPGRWRRSRRDESAHPQT